MNAVPLRPRQRPMRRPGPSFRERQRHLRLVRERRRRPRRRRRIIATFAVGLTAVTLFGVLAVHVRLTQTAFELQEAQQAVERMRSRGERLEMAEAELEAPGRIRREAMGRLGMVLPSVVHFVYVREVQETADERTEGGTDTAAPPASGP